MKLLNKIKYLVIMLAVFLIPSLTCNAAVMTQDEFEDLNISTAYVIGDYVFDLMNYNPTLKDLLVAARTIEGNETEIYKIQVRNGVAQYTKVFANTVHPGFPEVDVNLFVTKTNNARIETVLYTNRVTFYDNDGVTVFDTMNVEKGELVTAPINITRTGYTFNNWYTNSNYNIVFDFSKVINNDTNIFGKWDGIQYHVAFDDNTDDTVTNMPAIIDATYGTYPVLTLKPVRDHHVFLGWSEDQNATEATYQYNHTLPNLTTTSETVTLYAVWRINNYNVIYDTKSEVGVPTIDLDYGENYTLPSPKRSGYDFIGWTLDEDDTVEIHTLVNDNEILSEEDDTNVTLYALWDTKSYNIFLKSDAETIFKTLSYKYNEQLSTPDLLPSKPGYIINSWKTYYSEEYNPNVSDDFDFSGKMPDYDITLYPEYRAISYGIIFDSNGGNSLPSNPVYTYYDENITLPNATKEHYTFLGWSEDSSATVSDYKGNVILNLTEEDDTTVTLYAIYAPNNHKLRYKLTPSETYYTEDYGYNEQQVEYVSDPLKPGYTFNGWVTSYGGDTSYEFGLMPDEDVSIYASWSVNTYDITFDVLGGLAVENLTGVTYDSTYTLPTTTKENYVFLGWSKTNGSQQATYVVGLNDTNLATSGEVTLYAVWGTDANTYRIEFNKNSENATGTMDDKICIVGEPCTIPSVTTYTYDGYHLDYWSIDPSGGTSYKPGDSNNFDASAGSTITLYAGWDGNDFVIKYDKNDDSLSNDSWTIINDPISLRTHSSYATRYFDWTIINPGKNFVNWNTNPDGSGITYSENELVQFSDYPNNEITLYAQWERIIYDVYIMDDEQNYHYNSLPNSSNIYYGDILDYSVISPYEDKIGYSFVNWYKQIEPSKCDSGHYEGSTFVCDIGYVAQIIADNPYDFSTTITNNNLTLVPVRTPNKYNVKLDLNYDGSTPIIYEDINYDENKSVPVPTRVGYTFVGWGRTKDANEWEDVTNYIPGSETATFNNLTPVNGETATLYAIWKMEAVKFLGYGTVCEIDESYKCIVENGKTVLKDYETPNNIDLLVVDGKITIPDDNFDLRFKNKDYYTFDNWYELTGRNCSVDGDDYYCIDSLQTVNKTPISETSNQFKPSTYYGGRFVKKEYTVNFDLNNGTNETAPESFKIDYESEDHVLPDLTESIASGTITAPEHATFAGWIFKTDGWIYRYAIEDDSLSFRLRWFDSEETSITLEALWSYSQVEVEFDLNDDQLGATAYKATLYDNQSFTLPTADQITIGNTNLAAMLTDRKLSYWDCLDFNGWYAFGGEPGTTLTAYEIELFPSYEPTIKVTAYYSPNVVEVSYSAHTGSVLPTIDIITRGKSFTFPENSGTNTITNPEGEHFIGWEVNDLTDSKHFYLPGETINDIDHRITEDNIEISAVYLSNLFDNSKNYVVDTEAELIALRVYNDKINSYAEAGPITITVKQYDDNTIDLSTVCIGRNVTLVIDEDSVADMHDTYLEVFGTLKLYLTENGAYNILGQLEFYSTGKLFVNDVEYVGQTGAIVVPPRTYDYFYGAQVGILTTDTGNIIEIYGDATINKNNYFDDSYSENAFVIKPNDEFILYDGVLTINYKTILDGTIIDYATLEPEYSEYYMSSIIINDLGDGKTMTINQDASFDDTLITTESNFDTEVIDNRS